MILKPLGGLRRGSARSDLAVTFGGKVLQLVLAFAGNVIAARVLGPEDFGRFGLVIAVIMIAGTLADAGLTFATIRFVARFRDADPAHARSAAAAYFLLRSATAAAMAAVVIVLAQPLASGLLGRPELVPYLGLGSVTLVSLWLSSYPGTVMTGLAMFPRLALAGLFNATITVSGIALLAAAGALDLVTLVAWNVVLPVVSTLPAWLVLPEQWRPWRLAPARDGIRRAGLELARVGKWTAASTLGAMVAAQIDLLLMGRLAGPASTGAYSVAVTLATRLDILNQSLITVMMPRASRLTASEDLRAYTRKVVRASGMLAVGLAAVALAAQPAILLFYGEEYAPAITVFLVLLPVVLIDLVATSAMLVTFSTNQARLMATAEWLRAALVAGVSAALITPLGGVGAALARLASRAAVAVYTAWALRHRVFRDDLDAEIAAATEPVAGSGPPGVA